MAFTWEDGDWYISGAYAVNKVTGERLPIDYSAVEGSTLGTKKNLERAILYTLNQNAIPDKDTDGTGISRKTSAWRNISVGLNDFLETNSITIGREEGVQTGTQEISAPGLQGTEGETNPRLAAFNAYWNDLYSLKDGTGGADMLDRLEGAYNRQANADAAMANVQFQQGAMAQAQTVKQIADQVRAERMARLKSGMSEAQIANQDMQMMMTNVNALNEQAQMLGTNRAQAQLNQGLAKDQAYMEYLNQSAAKGQVAAGMAASDAGSAYQMAIAYAQQAGVPFEQAYKYVTNPQNNE